MLILDGVLCYVPLRIERSRGVYGGAQVQVVGGVVQ